MPLTFVQAYFSACRARQKLLEAIGTGAVSGIVAVVAAAVAGVAYGLTGMAVAWIVTQLAAGCWAVSRLRWLSSARSDMQSGPAAELADDGAPSLAGAPRARA